VLTYRCLTGTAPHYLAETICSVSSLGARQHLWSAESSTLLPCRRTGTERSTTTCSERAFSSRLPPRSSELHLRPFCSSRGSLMRADNVPRSELVRRSVLICHHVPAATNWFLMTLYGSLAAAVRQRHLNNIHFYYYYYHVTCA